MDCALPVLSVLWSFQVFRGLSCGLCGLRSGPQSLSTGFLGPKVLSTGFLGGPNRTGLPPRPLPFPSLAPQNRANGSRHPQSPGFWASPGLSRGLQGSPIPSNWPPRLSNPFQLASDPSKMLPKSPRNHPQTIPKPPSGHPNPHRGRRQRA